MTGIQYQCDSVRRDRLDVRGLRSGRPRGVDVALDETEVRRLLAVGVAVVELTAALEVVDVQRRTPMRVVAADVVEERRLSRWIELHLEEGAPAALAAAVRGVGVALRLTRRLRVGVLVAERHTEPGRNRQLEPMRHIAAGSSDSRCRGGV